MIVDTDTSHTPNIMYASANLLESPTLAYQAQPTSSNSAFTEYDYVNTDLIIYDSTVTYDGINENHTFMDEFLLT